jgi:hypothetical protein
VVLRVNHLRLELSADLVCHEDLTLQFLIFIFKTIKLRVVFRELQVFVSEETTDLSL